MEEGVKGENLDVDDKLSVAISTPK